MTMDFIAENEGIKNNDNMQRLSLSHKKKLIIIVLQREAGWINKSN